MRSRRTLSFLTVCAVSLAALSFNAFAQDEKTAADVIYVDEPIFIEEEAASADSVAAEYTQYGTSDDNNGTPVIFTQDYIENFGIVDDMVEVPANEKFNTLDGIIDSTLIDVDDYGISVAKIFTAEKDCILDRVKVYIPSAELSNNNYMIAVNTDVEAGDPDSGYFGQWLFPSMTDLTPGAYNYIDVDDVILSAGDTYSIIVTASCYWGDKMEQHGMPVTYGSLGEGISFVKSNTFYFNYNEPWTDLHTLNYSVPIDAETVPIPENFLTRPSLGVSDPSCSDGNILTNCYYDDFILSWGKVSGATGYRLYRWCADGTQNDYTLLATLATTSYNDTTAVSGKQYYYYVQAYNANGVSERSNVCNVSFMDSLEAPVISSVIMVDELNAKVSFVPTGDADYYQIYFLQRSKDNDYSWSYNSNSADSEDKLVTINCDRDYYNFDIMKIYVVARDDNGLCGVSEGYDISNLSFELKETTVKAVANNYQATIAWTPVEGAAYYDVYRGYESEDGYFASYSSIITGIPDTTYVDTDVVPGMTFKYEVDAYSADGIRYSYSYSPKVSVPTSTLAAPVLVDSSTYEQSSSRQYVDLAWTDVDGADYYKIYYIRETLNGRLRTPVLAGTTVDTSITLSMTRYSDYGYNYRFGVIACSDKTLKRSVMSNTLTEFIPQCESSSNNYVNITDSSYADGAVTLDIEWYKNRGMSNIFIFRSSLDNDIMEYIGDIDISGHTGTNYSYYTSQFVDDTVIAGTDYNYYAYYMWYSSTYDSELYEVSVPATVKPVIADAFPANRSVTLQWTGVDNASRYAVYTYVSGKYTLQGTTTDTVYTVTNLTNGGNYGFLVRAYVKNVWTPFTTDDIVFAKPFAYLEKPDIFEIGTTVNSATLKWGSVDGAEKYSVYTYYGGKYTLRTTTTANEYTVTGLTRGVEYGFLVRAVGNGLTSAFTADDVVYRTIGVEKPVVTLEDNGYGLVYASWNEIVGADLYAVYSYADGKYTALGNTTSNTYVAAMKQGELNGILVRARVAGQWSAFTEDDVKFILSESYSPSLGIVATAFDTTVYCGWDHVDGATSYALYSYDYNTKKYTLIGTTTKTAYNVTKLKNGTEYFFVVRAYVDGVWTYLDIADPTIYGTSATPCINEVYEYANAYDAFGTTVFVSWSGKVSDERYSVYLYDPVTNKYTLKGTTSAEEYVITGLTPNKEYGVLVRAYANGTWSSFNTDSINYITLTGGSCDIYVEYMNGSVLVEWDDEYASKYNVYTLDPDTGKYTLHGTTAGNSYTITGLTSGKEYGFLVRAYVNGAWTGFTEDDIVYETVDGDAEWFTCYFKNYDEDGHPVLAWPRAFGAEKYNVYYYISGKYTLIGTTTGDSIVAATLNKGDGEIGFLVRYYKDGVWSSFSTYDISYIYI